MCAVNLTGVFLCLKHEIKQMLAQGGGGAIVNTAWIAGLIGLPTSAHYVAAKHGVVGSRQEEPRQWNTRKTALGELSIPAISPRL